MNKPTNSESNPLSVLREAIKAVPAVKYALGVAGVAAALALIRGFVTDLRVAGFGILVMFGLMFLLVMFSAFSKTAAKDLRMFFLPVAWTFVFLTIVVPTFLVTSLFFGWPLPLKELIPGGVASPTPTPTIQSTPTPSPSPQSVAATSTPTPTATPSSLESDASPPPRSQDRNASGDTRASTFVARAHALYAQGKYQEAISECDKALRVSPGNKEAVALKSKIARTVDILNRE